MPRSSRPYDFWQYWRNTEDADVERFLKLFTTLPMTRSPGLTALGGSEINEAKKVLATEATALVHGRAAAERGGGDRAQTFEEGALAETLPTVEMAGPRSKPARPAVAVRRGRPRRVQRRGTPASPGRRGPPQRRPVKDDRRIVGLSDLGPKASSNYRSAARSTFWSAEEERLSSFRC